MNALEFIAATAAGFGFFVLAVLLWYLLILNRRNRK